VATSTTTQADPQVQTSLAFLKDLLPSDKPRDFAIRFWDGTTLDANATQPTRFTLVINHAGTVRRMFFPGGPLNFFQAYFRDDFDIEGDMVAFCDFCDGLDDHGMAMSIFQKLGLGWRLWRMPKVDRQTGEIRTFERKGAIHSKQRDQDAVRFHYDISNEFFALFLDRLMMYTSGIFADENDDIHAAQERKLDLICRKLRLKSGDRLLDIGCGWGGLALFAAKNYGAHVVGATLSKPQMEWANQKVREAGLEGRCRFDLVDYRDIDEQQKFDKITTIEVIEHFGSPQFATYFQKCWRLLRPGGTLFLQNITQALPDALRAGAHAVCQAHFFPDGEMASTAFAQHEAEKAGFEVRHVESFREHYALTLKRWLDTLEARHDEALRVVNEATYRIFRLCFASSRQNMLKNNCGVHQVVLAKLDGPGSGYPLRREDWFADQRGS
jgi:cyclopropane-fatty-acyl-phospholipid synthase